MTTRPKRKKDELYVDFIKVQSLSDIVRSTYMSDGTNLPIFSIKIGKKHKLFSIGEMIGFTRVAYTFTTEQKGRICLYTPRDNNENEKVEITNSYSKRINYKSYVIPIIEFVDNPFKEKGISGKDIVVIPTDDYKSIAMGVVSKNKLGGIVSNMYMFTIKNKVFLGSFNLITSVDKRVFVYSELDFGTDFKFLKCNRLTNEIIPTNKYSNDVCISIIHLSKPFDFFKPE